MFKWEADNAVFIQEQKTLEAAMTTDPKVKKALQQLVRQVILQARRDVVRSIEFTNGDPRNTRQAVRTTVYRKVFGGNINILNSKKAHGTNSYEPPRKLRPEKRGGNRMARSPRTQQIMSYSGLDREFIMRFVDSGTKQRFVGFRNAQKSNSRRYLDTKQRWDLGGNRTGNRGSIAARGFFARYGERALEIAADKLATLIDTELTNILDKK